MSEHILPLRVYYAVFGALMALTAVTTAVAYLDLGALNVLVALGIASTKGMLVILYFMHVRYSPRLVRIFAFSGLVFLLILFAFLSSDYFTRHPIEGWT